MRLHNNKILITGATEGIGHALTLKMLSLNNTIIAVGRNEERLRLLGLSSTRIIPFRCDLARLADLEQLTHFIEQQHPDLNILINNAGVQYNYGFDTEPHLLARIDHEVQVNLLAPLRLTALLLPVLKANDNAAIVHVSSGLALAPKRQAPVYCATKAALHSFSQALRYQLQQVRVFEILPPLVDTAMTEGRGKGKIAPEKVAEAFVKGFARNRYEIAVGKVRLLQLLLRVAPRLARRIMQNGR